MPPTANQILLQLKAIHTCTTAPMITAGGFELLIHAIALQLLASCYTMLPATSACHLPLFQQRNRPTPVTALRLHTQYRFEPAAGHHARSCSEAAPWPGLYTGPASEDKATEVVTLQQRQRRNSYHVPCFAASGWTDGPFSPEAQPIRRRLQSSSDSSSSSSSSSSWSEPGFFSKLICQASTPKNPRRKYNTLFTSIAARRNRPLGTLHTRSDSSKPHHSRPKALQNLKSQAVQRIPSSVRLRRTQSAPRIVLEESSPTAYKSDSRRHSSNPSIGSPVNYPFEIPEIHRTSATPTPSQKRNRTVRLCGRGDLIAGDDSQRSTSMYSSESSMHSDQNHTLSLPAQIPEIMSSISPRDTSTLPRREPNDYFASVHAATHIYDDKGEDIDDEDDLTTERENAGPRLDECPRLQEMFAKMDRSGEGDISDDTSDDSEIETTRKRRSMWIDPGSPSREFVARFERQRQETRLMDDE
jgi:hypothetical protein